MTFSKPTKGDHYNTFNRSVYVKMIESDRIHLYDCVMNFKLHLTEKKKWLELRYKISFAILIFVFNYF